MKGEIGRREEMITEAQRNIFHINPEYELASLNVSSSQSFEIHH